MVVLLFLDKQIDRHIAGRTNRRVFFPGGSKVLCVKRDGRTKTLYDTFMKTVLTTASRSQTVGSVTLTYHQPNILYFPNADIDFLLLIHW